MPRRKLIFINPPGSETFIRGYFCSQTSKADYLIQPIDFICLSGFLARDFDLFLLDAVRDHLTSDTALKEVRRIRPDVAICLVGMVSQEEDLPFIHALKQAGVPMVAALGDLLLDETRPPGDVIPGLDRILPSFIDDPQLYPVKPASNQRLSVQQPGPSSSGRTFLLPVPRHELFLHSGYSLPFARSSPYATVLTDFGCPYTCRFCVMGTLGYRYRPVENVLEELAYLRHLRVTELFFIDQSFGVHRRRTEALLQAMIRNNWRFSWTCYSRVDLVDRELLQLMKQAGCHTIMFGVESGSENILRQYGKGYTLSQVRLAFRLCRQLGLRTVGTFLLGFPEDTRETCQATIDLACSLGCSFASFNFAFPRRRTILSRGATPTASGDQSGRHLATGTRTLTVSELEQFRNQAIRRFYFRPAYLLRRILQLRSAFEWRNHLRNAFGLLKRIFPRLS